MAGKRELIISSSSAIAFWRAARLGGIIDNAPDGKVYGAGALSLNELVDRARLMAHCDGKVHCLFSSKANRSHADGIASHVWTGPLPPSQLHRLGPQLSVCRPALALMTLAKDLDEIDLAMLSYELVGTYAIASWEDGASRSLSSPACGIEEIRSFATACAACGVFGARRLLRALEFVVAMSNSPVESKISLFMEYLAKRGGFGLTNVELNAKIELSDAAADILGFPSMRPDFKIVPQRSARRNTLLIEYESDEAHKSRPGAFERDNLRRDALALMGYRAFGLTNEQVHDPAQFKAFMNGIRRALNMRPLESPEHDRRFMELHRRLFGSGYDALDEAP